MVQVLRNREQSFLQSLLGGAAAGAGSTGQMLPQLAQLGQMKQQQAAQQQRAQAMRSYGEQLGVPNFEHLDPTIQRLIAVENFKQPKPVEPLTIKDISGYFKNLGFDNDQLSQIGLDEWEALMNRANALAPHVGQEQALLQAIKEFQSPERYAGGEQAGGAAPAAEGEGVLSPFQKGLKGSISGRIPAILGGMPAEEFEKATALGPEANFLERLMHGAGGIAGNIPYYAAGGTLGAQAGSALGSTVGPFGTAAGGIVGGGAGALGLPAVLDQALTEYHQWQSRGFEGSFEDFIRSGNKIAQEGLSGATEGAIFSILGEALPALKAASPQLKKLIEKSKAPEAALKTAIEGTGLLGAKAAAKGELPTSGEIADTFAMILGMNVAGKVPKAMKRVENAIRMTGEKPEVIARDVAKEMKAQGVDASDVREVERIINDVTKSYIGPERETAKSVMETLRNIKTPEPRATAEALAERPIEETLEGERKKEAAKMRPLTEKEQAKRQKAQEGAEQLQTLIDRAGEDITALEGAAQDPRAKDRKLYESALRSKQEELVDLQKKQKSLIAIAEKGVEPFSKEALKEPIEKHMAELEEAARNPEGETAKEWQRMFERDTKYIHEFESLLKKGKLPEAPYRDRYVRMLDAYQEAYSNFLKQAETSIKEKTSALEGVSKRSKAYKTAAKELEYLNNAFKLTRKNEEINRAKAGRQLDRVSQLYALKQPGASITKQILKSLRPDLEAFQRDFIKQKKTMEALDQRANKLFDIKVRVLDQLLKEYAKNPTETRLRQIASEGGVELSDLNKMRSEGKKVAEQMVRDAKENVSEERFIEKAMEMIDKTLPENKFIRTVLAAVVGTEIQNALEFLVGFKVPISTISFGVGSLLGQGLRSGFYSYGLGGVYKKLKEKRDQINLQSEYRQLKSGAAKAEFVKRLKRKGNSPSEIKAIVR